MSSVGNIYKSRTGNSRGDVFVVTSENKSVVQGVVVTDQGEVLRDMVVTKRDFAEKFPYVLWTPGKPG